MTLYERVFDHNRHWAAQQLQQDADYFNRMTTGQQPEFLYIGCSDSRVQPEAFLGIQSGEVFVHRNIANLVPDNDTNALAVVRYAVEHLQVKHIIVCGHYGCGGIKAAMDYANTDEQNEDELNRWIRNIDHVYRRHRTELAALPDEMARYRRLVELNVQEQCQSILKLPFVQKARNQTDYPHIHGWVYDIADGTLIDLVKNMALAEGELVR